MNKSIFLSVPLIISLGSFSTVHAADGTINFTGSIRDSACKIDTTSSQQTVNLGSVSASSFNSAGSSVSSAKFMIKLTDCPSAVKNASVSFDGPLAKGNSSLLALSSGQTATNVGVGIYEQDSSTLIPMGSASNPVLLNSKGVNELNYIAKYVSTGAKVGAGSADAATSFTIVYN